MYKIILLLAMLFVAVIGFLSLSSDFVLANLVKKNVQFIYGKKPSMRSIGIHYLEKEIQILDLEAQTSKDRTRLIKVDKLSLKFGGLSIFSKKLEGKDLVLEGVYMNIKLDSVSENKSELEVENNLLETLMLNAVAQTISIRKILLKDVHIRVVGENIDKQLQIEAIEWKGFTVESGVQDLIQKVAQSIQTGLDQEIVRRLKVQVADDLSTQFKNKFMDFLNSSQVKEGQKTLENKSKVLKDQLVDIFSKALESSK
ncbi:hypothetical protein MJH12_00850 [bacterium]|nr:hypothetical protein [bacterium]